MQVIESEILSVSLADLAAGPLGEDTRKRVLWRLDALILGILKAQVHTRK
jgi:hypothetical protein